MFTRLFIVFFAAISVNTAGNASSLVDRYRKLACAVVRIDYSGGSGTGFFIDDQGHLATASHVAFERSFSLQSSLLTPYAPAQPVLALAPHTNASMIFNDGHREVLSIQNASTENLASGTADVVVLDTTYKSSCFIPLRSKGHPIGTHVIGIGFPASNPTPVLYEGFIAADHTHLPTPIGQAGNVPIQANYEVLRIQMPMTPGASGSPIIDDDNVAIGIASEIPVVIANDVQQLAHITGLGGAMPGGVQIGPFNVLSLIGHLSSVVIEFESPGAVFAVPTTQLPAHYFPAPK